MRTSWDSDVDGLQSWAELQDLLREPWHEVRDGRTGLALSTHFDELLVDPPASGTAAQRRALHRAGFRRRDDVCWSWTPAEPVDLPPAPDSFLPSMAQAWCRHMRERAVDRARSTQALLVLRDVYRSAPADLVVTFPPADEDEWDDDDEDDDAWPALDCATLDALARALRRTGRMQPP